MAILHLKINVYDKATHCTGCQLLRSGPAVFPARCLLFGDLKHEKKDLGTVDLVPVTRDMRCHMSMRNWVLPDREPGETVNG